MSQNPTVIANGSGSTVRAALNAALDSLATTNSGNSRPSGIQAGQPWIDTNTPSASVWSLYYYDGTHDIKLGELNTTSGLFTPFGAGASLLAGGTTNTSSTSLSTMANVQASMTGGFVNKFRNGQMAVAQRGTSGTITAGSPAYTVDGWIVSATGANISWSQLASFSPSSYYLEINGATSNTDVLIKQRIEGEMAAPLAGQTVTVQFAIGNFTGSAMTPKLTVKHAGALDDWSSPVTDVNAVNTEIVSDSTNAVVAYTFSADANSVHGLEISLDFGAIGNTKFVNVGACDIRATPGVSTGANLSTPAPELRPLAAELPLCQRYFEKSFPQGTAPAQNSGVAGYFMCPQCVGSSTSQNLGKVSFRVVKRAVPSVTLYNPSAANAQARDVSAGADCSSTATSGVVDSGFTLGATTASGSSAGDGIAVHWSATAEL